MLCAMLNPVRLACVGIFLSCPVVAHAQQHLNLSGAIELALKQNPELTRTGMGLESARLREADADLDFRPTILPEFASSRFGSDSASRVGVRATQKFDLGTTVSGSVGEVHSSLDGGHLRPSKRFEIQQALFRNFNAEANRFGIYQAASASIAARRRYELEKADLVLRVVQTYENILRLQYQLSADREAYRRQDALHRLTEAKELAGKTNSVDTLRVALLRGQAEARLEADAERLVSAQRDLTGYLGLPMDTSFDLQAENALELDLPTAAQAVDVALENRLDYIQAIQDYEDARRAARIAGRRTLPDVRLTVSYDDFPTTSTSFGSVPFGKPLWFVGLSVPTDYNLSRERIAVQQARIAEGSAEQAMAVLKTAIARQVMQQLQTYQRSLAELKIAERNLDLAERRAKVARAMFELGRGDNFSATDAEVSLVQAESQLFAARTDASISAYQFARVLGQIVEVPAELKVRRAP
jgi:outer membrane protein TolC